MVFKYEEDIHFAILSLIFLKLVGLFCNKPLRVEKTVGLFTVVAHTWSRLSQPVDV